MSSPSIGETQASGNINGDSSDVRLKRRLVMEQHGVNPVYLEKPFQYNSEYMLYIGVIPYALLNCGS
jgi:hypothetical protein